MKSLIYFIVVCFCAWIIIEPKDSYKAPELPEVKLQANESLNVDNLEIDTIILNIEKNIKYLNNTKITEN